MLIEPWSRVNSSSSPHPIGDRCSLRGSFADLNCTKTGTIHLIAVVVSSSPLMLSRQRDHTRPQGVGLQFGIVLSLLSVARNWIGVRSAGERLEASEQTITLPKGKYLRVANLIQGPLLFEAIRLLEHNKMVQTPMSRPQVMHWFWSGWRFTLYAHEMGVGKVSYQTYGP